MSYHVIWRTGQLRGYFKTLLPNEIPPRVQIKVLFKFATNALALEAGHVSVPFRGSARHLPLPDSSSTSRGPNHRPSNYFSPGSHHKKHRPIRVALDTWSLLHPATLLSCYYRLSTEAAERERRENLTSHPEKDRSEVSTEIGAGVGRESGGDRRPEIHAGGAKGTPLIDPIMLRFRPIAPKPATGDFAAGTTTPESFQRPFSRRKVKRKYVKVQKKNQCNVKNDNTNRSAADGGGAAGSDGGGAVETLQLFRGRLESDPLLVQINSSEILPGTSAAPDPKVVESRVTVESVGGPCGGWEHPGTILELDTCPSFVTDYSFSRVMWVNEAYTRLVSGGGGGEVAATVAVRLVVKEELPQWRTAFTCRVRLEHTWQKERYSKLVPCDVWRVDYWGGFAWRLDVKAALSLGF